MIEVEPTERGTAIKVSIDALGAVTRTSPGGQSNVEPPRDSEQARRAAAQLERHPPNRAAANTTAKAAAPGSHPGAADAVRCRAAPRR